MVIVEVTGARKKKAALARDAAIFAFNYLMPRAKKDVDVEIIFTKMNGVCGYQAETGDRQFEIEIDKRHKCKK